MLQQKISTFALLMFAFVATSCARSDLMEACGNGIMDPEEECDDGNNNDGDGCNWACEIEGATDTDADSDADTDADTDTDIDIDVDTDTDIDVDVDTDTDTETETATDTAYSIRAIKWKCLICDPEGDWRSVRELPPPGSKRPILGLWE